MSENDTGENDNGLNEWSTARDVLDKFDERVHDLRKYGFSFVTALIGAEALLKPENLSNPIKLTVIWVTLGLIIALRLFEQYYQNFQEAAATRAGILEKRLNLELTDTISHTYADRKMWRYRDWMYGAFAFLVGIFGASLLWPNIIFAAFSIVSSFIAVIIVWFIGKRIEFKPKFEVDWTVYPLVRHRGKPIWITLTNLGEKITIPARSTVWRILTQDGKDICSEIIDDEIVVEHGGSYVWLLDTMKMTNGIYNIYPRDRKYPLRRKISVIPSEKK